MNLQDFIDANKKELDKRKIVMAHPKRGYAIILREFRAMWEQWGWEVVHEGAATPAPKGVKKIESVDDIVTDEPPKKKGGRKAWQSDE